ncbi:hypothetical protein [Flavobacterium sp. 25HG05S-40]|uniref:hypothetical protein n=1 Tax=Flavobacterium sp. 25HG05S-40 TaxID=3458682 RepID=UPI0040439C56
MKQNIIYKLTLSVLWLCSYCNAQTTDYIVTTAHDTIAVDKITVTDLEVKTKIGDNKKKYKVDDIISYYIAQKDEYYERVPIEKKERKAPERYDYKRNESFYLEQYENDKKFKFIQRLTQGKVKLFCEVEHIGASGKAGREGYIAPSENRTYYIALYDSKLEPVIKESNFKLFDFSYGLTLNTEVYELLKQYLHGNQEIRSKLDHLYTSRPKAKEKQIVELITEYNLWVTSNQ